MKAGIFVISCWKNYERREAIRKTWKTLSTLPVFFVCGQTPTPMMTLEDCSDIICVQAPDDYLGLAQKIQQMCLFAQGAGFDSILKVDDDTFVAADRIVIPIRDYVGKVVRNAADKPWYCHGGAGYWLTRPALTAVAASDPKGWLSEDALVAWSVCNAGCDITSTPRHNVEVGPDRWKMLPRTSNDFVTCGEFDVWELRRAFDLYQKDDREDRMTADEYKRTQQQPTNQPDTQPNGLALEYQLEYGSANRDLNVSDLVNNPTASGKCRVNSSLTEHGPDSLRRLPDTKTFESSRSTLGTPQMEMKHG